MVNKKYTTVEAARGIAASVVVFYHVSRHYMHNTGEMPFGSIFLFGHAGVDFFFVLSGFIIYLIHQGDIGSPKSASRFVFRRVIRIYPIFWVAFLIACILAVLGGHGFPAINIETISDFLLLPGDTIIGVSWSLRHEILFYTYFLILIYNKILGMTLGIIWVLLILLNPSGLDGVATSLLVSKYNLQFFMGILVAYFISNERYKDLISIRNAKILLFFGCMLFALFAMAEVFSVLDGYADNVRFAYGLSTALILYSLVRLEQLDKCKAPAFLVFLGSISYSLYLMHLFGTGVANKVLEYTGLHSILGIYGGFSVMVIGGFTAGIISGVYIEKPLLRFCRKFESLFVR